VGQWDTLVGVALAALIISILALLAALWAANPHHGM